LKQVRMKKPRLPSGMSCTNPNPRAACIPWPMAEPAGPSHWVLVRRCAPPDCNGS
jgi:hypothetical protein